MPPLDPYTPESRLLAQILDQQRRQPIYSVGQGLAQLAGDLGQAYFQKKALQKDEARAKTQAEILAQAMQTGMQAGNTAGGPPMSPQMAGMQAFQDMRAADPQMAVQYGPEIMKMAQQFAPPTFTGQLGRGERAFIGGQQVAEGAPDVPEILQPGVLEARTQIAAAGRPQTTIDQRGESAYVTARSGDYAKAAAGYQDAGRAAALRLGQRSALKELLSDPNVYQGTAGPAIASLKRAGKTLFGLDIEGVGGAEVAQKIGAEQALSLKSNLPGPMSDSDRKFLLDLPLGLGNSREGNVILAEYQDRMDQRQLEIAELARIYEAENKQLDVGFDALLADYAAQNPIFTDEDWNAVRRLASTTQQPTPTAGADALLRAADEIATGVRPQ